MTKAKEIAALENLLAIAKTGDSYIGEFFTEDRINQMINNIRDDFPIDMHVDLVEAKHYEAQTSRFTADINELTGQIQAMKEAHELKLREILDNICESGNWAVAYANFSQSEVIKHKLYRAPEELTLHERQLLASMI